MPKMFGPGHLTFLAIYVILAITGFIFIYNANEKKSKLIIRILGGCLTFFALAGRFVDAFIDLHLMTEFIFHSFCSLASFTLGIACMIGKKDAGYYHFICPLAFIGGLMGFIIPDYLDHGPTLFYLPTLVALIHHGLAAFLVVVLIAKGEYIPTVKKWYWFPLLMTPVILLGYFEIYVLKMPSAYFIEAPALAGTPFYWYIIVPAEYAGYMLICLLFDSVRKNKKSLA